MAQAQPDASRMHQPRQGKQATLPTVTPKRTLTGFPLLLILSSVVPRWRAFM